MRRGWRWVLAFAGLLLIGYPAGLGLLYATQRSFIYPAPNRPWPSAEGFRTITYPTRDGLNLRALYRPAMPGKPTILFFHGNGDSLSGSLVSTETYAAQGYGLLLAEYRGYGGNPGSPDEAGLYADGRAARDWLKRQQIAADRLIVMGFSLGTGVASQLALEEAPAALVLISPYTSIPDAAAFRFGRLVPSQWLVKDRFETKTKIGRITCPILILHDRDDRSIPASQGEALARLSTARLVLFSGYGHQLGFAPAAHRASATWLAVVLG